MNPEDRDDFMPPPEWRGRLMTTRELYEEVERYKRIRNDEMLHYREMYYQEQAVREAEEAKRLLQEEDIKRVGGGFLTRETRSWMREREMPKPVEYGRRAISLGELE